MDINEQDKIKAIEQQVLSQNLMNLKNQINGLNLQTDELKRLKESLNELKGMKERKPQVSVGNGLFLEAKLEEPKDVLMNIGANIIVKKDFNSSLKIVDKQIDEFEKIKNQMNKELQKLDLTLMN